MGQHFFIPETQVTGRQAADYPWENHPWGPPDSWPVSLQGAVGVMLNSHFPMFLTWGPERRFIYNDAYIPILGPRHPQAFGRPFEKIWHEIWPDLIPMVESVDRGQAQYHENLRLIMQRHGFDEEVFFTFSYSPLRDEAGKVRGLFCACIETTRERQLEVNLRKSRESLELALSSAQMGTWEVDLPSGRVRFSKEAADIFGTTPDHASAYSIIENLIDPAEGPRVRQNFDSAITTGDPYFDEYRVRLPDGGSRWIYARGRVSRDAEGRPNLLSGLVMDTTEQRRAADILAEAQDRLNLALVSSGIGFWDWNARTGFTFLSQTLMKDWGIDPETYRNTLPEALARIHPDDRAATWGRIESATFAGETYDVEYRVVRPNGEIIWVNAKGKYYVDQNGEPERLSGITVNTTERKKAEEALQNAVSARDQFLSIASHELKTPLTSLHLQTQLHRRALKRGDDAAYLPQRVNALVEQTEKQISRLTRLVDDMLDVSRIRAGKMKMQFELFSLADLTRDVIHRLSDQFSGGGYAVPELITTEPLTIRGDRYRIEQVVINLLTNAIRYGRKRPIVVKMADHPEFVSLAVKDEGIGIAPAAQARIFDRFERAVDENEVSGLGLGLFITREIVAAHEGSLRVDSEVGRGSTFWVELPKNAPEPPVIPEAPHGS